VSSSRVRDVRGAGALPCCTSLSFLLVGWCAQTRRDCRARRRPRLHSHRRSQDAPDGRRARAASRIAARADVLRRGLGLAASLAADRGVSRAPRRRADAVAADQNDTPLVTGYAAVGWLVRAALIA